MNRTNTILVMLSMAMAALVLAPTASADHGSHECTDEDPCDNMNNKGCDPLISVGGCTYEGHSNCYYGRGADGQQATYCYHYSKDCLVNLVADCHVHGSTLTKFIQ